ncbi:MAG: AbfB domain-containing protein, partial [Spirochaetales bacterium]|nr:AbfB domain-containing protein [Spirochaetales bacterium]
MKFKNWVIIILFFALGFTSLNAWQKASNPIWTTWGETIDPNNTLQEYPRPQLVRSGSWINLNGVWRCKEGFAGDAVPVGQNLTNDILVPFPVESAISGVKQSWRRIWYRRTITIPSDWAGKRILLHFGAVDWESEVYVNGASLGVHRGGYDPFTYDISNYAGAGTHELIVRVWDPTGEGDLTGPKGKQNLGSWNNAEGIWYTPSSGIWQTVWLESVPTNYITNIRMLPDIDNNRLQLTVNANTSLSVAATAYDGSAAVGSATGSTGSQINISIPSAKLWSPSSPFLYNLTVTVSSGNTIVDTINSYFGMRKISVGSHNGNNRLLLNNKFLFQMGPLDQGFWPDGLYTAPSDAALKYDIQMSKNLGFNMIRKHIKVEPARWMYWCDVLGMLVWQDIPSARNTTATDQNQFRVETERIINANYNSPSIIQWVVFNEQWGIYDSVNVTNWVKSLDPSRIANENSACCGGDSSTGDIRDWHNYVPPTAPTYDGRAIACGEFGGLGYNIAGHLWDSDGPYMGYEWVYSADELATKYEGLIQQVNTLRDLNRLSAAVYTEITDLENELNGFITYDRKIVKCDQNRIKVANESTWKPTYVIGTVVPTSAQSAQSWQYTTSAPASDWYTAAFNDSGWAAGNGGFGSSGTPGAVIGTTWTSADIWIRRHFNPGNMDRNSFMLNVHHDEAAEIYINGVLAASLTGYTSAYGSFTMNQAAKDAIVMNGDNVLAVHCNQTTGGQYIDAGIISKGTINPINPPSGSSAWASHNFPEYYIRHAYSRGRIDAAVSPVQDAYWNMVPGLAGAGVSFESVNFPGTYLRHQNSEIWQHANDGTALFAQDATFYMESGLADGSRYSFQSYNMAGQYIRHANFLLRIDTISDDLARQDATFRQIGGGGTNTATPTPSSTWTPVPTVTQGSTATPTPTPNSNLTDITNLGGTISAQYTDSPSGEDIAKLIDNSTSTKYLTFHASGWVQYYLSTTSVITRYTISSANDAAERDPYTWTLQGSTNGSSWVTMDSRSGEDFPNRFQTREFTFSNSTAYTYYRLNMTNNSGTILQISEWELYGTTGSTVTNTPTPTNTTAYTATPTNTTANTATATPTRTPTPSPTQNTNLTDITNLGGTISAQYTDSPSGEDIAKLIDNSTSTKYLTFHA